MLERLESRRMRVTGVVPRLGPRAGSEQWSVRMVSKSVVDTTAVEERHGGRPTATSAAVSVVEQRGRIRSLGPHVLREQVEIVVKSDVDIDGAEGDPGTEWPPGTAGYSRRLMSPASIALTRRSCSFWPAARSPKAMSMAAAVSAADPFAMRR